MDVSFIGEGNQSTQRKSLTCRKSLTNCLNILFHNYTRKLQCTCIIISLYNEFFRRVLQI